jgi:hypothetical protein
MWRKKEELKIKESSEVEKMRKVEEKQGGDAERKKKNVEERKKSGVVFVIKANGATKRDISPLNLFTTYICIVLVVCKIM